MDDDEQQEEEEQEEKEEVRACDMSSRKGEAEALLLPPSLPPSLPSLELKKATNTKGMW